MRHAFFDILYSNRIKHRWKFISTPVLSTRSKGFSTFARKHLVKGRAIISHAKITIQDARRVAFEDPTNGIERGEKENQRG